jgi:signal transduction histidine kinase/iron only hydrogenase large subunit-like protein
MENLIEVIGIKEENCINCHQCIAVCPVKVCSDGSGDVVKFNNHLCIGCGRCIEACIKSHGGIVEKSARFPIDDAAEFITQLPEREMVALVAPSAQSNFPLRKLITGLKMLGVKAVYDVSLGAEITVASYHKLIASGQVRLPLIAQPCPAIVTYLEIYQPGLLKYLAPIGSPVHNTAVYVKSLHPDSELVFISPCLAKRREFQKSKMVQYNVIYQSIEKIFKDNNIVLDNLEDSDFDNRVSAGIATNFSSSGGLSECYQYNYPDTSTSEIREVNGPLAYDKYLPELQIAIFKKDPNLPLIVDILSCRKGCNIGPGCINHHRSLDRIERTIAVRSEQGRVDEPNRQQLKDFLRDVIKQHDFSYHSYKNLATNNTLKLPSETELHKIYHAMHKTEPKDFRNCAACGYNSCYYMAIAIFNGLNKGENCHLYQEKELLREQEILNEMVEELAQLNEQLQSEFNERKQQEQILIQNSKLAAMGEMIGMIAHQWRQPLSSISTLAGNLQVYLDLDMFDKNQFKELLNDINVHAQYLSNTINDFRHFFKPDNPKDMIVMTQVIENTLGIIGKSLEYNNVTLIKDYSFSTPILTYPNELMQVLLNLIKNASDAFVDNKVIKPQITIRGFETDDYLEVEVYDNAGGIPDEIINKVFDPYFSTKTSGIGTGLGLYISRTIVQEHCRGQLLARNTEEGACFTIKLPLD